MDYRYKYLKYRIKYKQLLKKTTNINDIIYLISINITNDTVEGGGMKYKVKKIYKGIFFISQTGIIDFEIYKPIDNKENNTKFIKDFIEKNTKFKEKKIFVDNLLTDIIKSDDDEKIIYDLPKNNFSKSMHDYMIKNKLDKFSVSNIDSIEKIKKK